MSKKPVIAILPEIMEDSEYAKYSSKPWYAVRECYAKAVSAYGGVPIMFTHMHDNIDDMLSIVDAIIIAGGDSNIPPEMYGEEQKYPFQIGRQRAEFEVKLLKKAFALNMPIMGICHGMQIINVALGGSLYQNILKDVPGAMDHQHKSSRDKACHDINIVDNSMLHKITGLINSQVNSSHSQSINKVGQGLRVAATAPDGVIEAIESTEHDFVLGFEWHPEFLVNPKLDAPLFQSLIDAAKLYSVSVG